jgi:hypothetical protein
MHRTTLLRVPVLDWKLYLHQFVRGDEDRELHDHPWHFWSWVIAGEYVEVLSHDCPRGDYLSFVGGKPQLVHTDRRPRWSIRYRTAHHSHRVETSGCWTICLCSHKVRSWGFWDALGGWTGWQAYLAKKGCYDA